MPEGKEISVTKLENLKEEYLNIKKQLEDLKNELKDKSDPEGWEKAENLNKEAKKKEEEIKTAIDNLRKSTLNESDEEKIKEIEKTLETEKEQVSKLSEEILSWLRSSSKETSSSFPKSTDSTKKKNIFQKAWWWVWEQRDDVWSSEKWKEKAWTNTLRTLWFTVTWVWAVALAYEWIKRLRNWAFWKKKKNGDNKSDTEKKDKTSEKKSFWNTWFWKALKWLWFWSAAWGWVYFLGKTFNWRWNENPTIASTWNIDTSKVDTSKIDTSKVDTSWFTPWPYPFKHITTPFKWIKQYKVDDVKLTPLIWFNQLSLKWTEWELITLKVKDQKLHFNSTKTAWYIKKNPCNVSPFEGDVWRIWSSLVADWQNHGKYDSMESGLASFMRLMRKDRYRNKSIQWINCSWLQRIYDENEPDSLKALRIIWITHACKSLNVSPFVRLNTDDKETMMAFAQQTAINETWAYFDRATLERAYKKAFG